MVEVRLIVNPSSGREESVTYVDRVKEILQEKYDTLSIRYTEKAGDAANFAREAAQEQVDTVIMMGGDGTVSEGVNGLAEQPFRPKFSLIPLGTMNDLARALGISLDPDEAIEQLIHLKEKKLDIGKVNDHYFMDVVAIGTLPEAVHQVKPEQKTKLGPFAYFIQGAKALSESTVYHFNLNVDGEEIAVESMLIIVALTNSVGGFERMLPHARVDDGQLHLLVLKGDKIVNKLKVIPKIFTGEAIHDDQVLYRPFQTATIEKMENTELIANVDGDKGDALPLRLEVLPQHLTVLVPENTKK
ncbi:diacylglycerol/lipid kinase family protein [Jeotgalibaca caeni]|uniref:diacylglycerol/lipid kinase family protein n=1 Tax=Jeotgalibaca caeni TaxID=3028623 RepID=UPI00237EA4DD|nr:diacylglycerol kinase family protein [Jeotgalibaca caeni]MDE1550031.1 diacylglycerol kinase family lipid kinase [Jeotgalibaca caeni]